MSVCLDGSLERPDPGVPEMAASDLERAFSRLYAEQFDRVYGLLGRYGIPTAELEDLAQQVFSVAFHHRRELTRLEHPRAWLAAITVRVVREHYRWRRVRRLKAWLVEHSWAARGADEWTPEREALRSEASERVRGVLGRMSTKLRDALVLCELEELGTREAAEILAVPQNTLRSRQRLARAEFLRLWQLEESEGGAEK